MIQWNKTLLLWKDKQGQKPLAKLTKTRKDKNLLNQRWKRDVERDINERRSLKISWANLKNQGKDS
jgi:hypothetical protein